MGGWVEANEEFGLNLKWLPRIFLETFWVSMLPVAPGSNLRLLCVQILGSALSGCFASSYPMLHRIFRVVFESFSPREM